MGEIYPMAVPSAPRHVRQAQQVGHGRRHDHDERVQLLTVLRSGARVDRTTRDYLTSSVVGRHLIATDASQPLTIGERAPTDWLDDPDITRMAELMAEQLGHHIVRVPAAKYAALVRRTFAVCVRRASTCRPRSAACARRRRSSVARSATTDRPSASSRVYKFMPMAHGRPVRLLVVVRARAAGVCVADGMARQDALRRQRRLPSHVHRRQAAGTRGLR